jgi:hypothetical protein
MAMLELDYASEAKRAQLMQISLARTASHTAALRGLRESDVAYADDLRRLRGLREGDVEAEIIELEALVRSDDWWSEDD